LIRVCLVGLGKTGKEIAKVILEQENMKLVSVVCSSKSQNLGKSLDEIIGCRNSGIIVVPPIIINGRSLVPVRAILKSSVQRSDGMRRVKK